VIRYFVEGDQNKPREQVYDRSRRNSAHTTKEPSDSGSPYQFNQNKEIKILGFKKMKSLKPFIYPNSSTSEQGENKGKSKRYVNMIKRVMKKLRELKLKIDSKPKNEAESEYDEVLKNPSLLIEFMDPNFDIIRPNLDYLMEEKLIPEFENHNLSKYMKSKWKKLPPSKSLTTRQNIHQKYSKYYLPAKLMHLSQFTPSELSLQKDASEKSKITEIKQSLLKGISSTSNALSTPKKVSL
jgi:hypothetical protein